MSTDDQNQGSENGTSENKEGAASAEDGSKTQDELFSTEWLRSYFAKAMGIDFGPKPEVLLDEISFEGIARYIKSDKCQKIVTMVGAGISTSAGLPDFRTPGSGLYEKLAKYNLSTPQQAFDVTFFRQNPEPYYMIRRDMFAALVKPTPCHYFIKLLEQKNKLLRHYTQNIDGLEREAGISEDKLVEAHGSYKTSHCILCNKEFDQDYCIEKMFGSESPVPHCDIPECNGILKPDVVMFGESLPQRFAKNAPSDLDNCDMLIIMGTSLVVAPFNTIVNRTKENTPRLYINMENKVGGKRHPISVLFFGGGFEFGEEDNIRDVYWQGACDDGCYALADLIGWGDELRETVKTEHERIDSEWRAAGTEKNTPEKNEGASSAEDGSKTQDELFSTEWLRSYFTKAMGIDFGPKPEVLLDEISFEGIARYIKSDKCQKVVTMVGAGISTSAGLPDFRTPGSGLYEKLAKYNLSTPQQAFDVTFFRQNPEPYYMIRRDMFAAQVKPTPCHYFIKLLEKKNKLLRHYTQNIDGLEREAGISEDKLVEAHGSYRTSHCILCNKEFGQDYCIEKMFGSESPVPHCDIPECNGILKPDVVMFGESLPQRFAKNAPTDLDNCDMLIIMGTSLVVAPFNTIVNRTKENTPRLYINMENKVGGKRHPISVLFFGGGFEFGEEDNIRDVYWQGACDDGCFALADLMGWGDELRETVKTEHERIDNEWRAAGKIVPPPQIEPKTTITSNQNKPKTTTPTNQNKANINNNSQKNTKVPTTGTKNKVPSATGATRPAKVGPKKSVTSTSLRDSQKGANYSRPTSTVKRTGTSNAALRK